MIVIPWFYNYNYETSDDIYHAGIKGMKWGYNKGKRNGNRIAELIDEFGDNYRRGVSSLRTGEVLNRSNWNSGAGQIKSTVQNAPGNIARKVGASRGLKNNYNAFNEQERQNNQDRMMVENRNKKMAKEGRTMDLNPLHAYKSGKEQLNAVARKVGASRGFKNNYNAFNEQERQNNQDRMMVENRNKKMAKEGRTMDLNPVRNWQRGMSQISDIAANKNVLKNNHNAFNENNRVYNKMIGDIKRAQQIGPEEGARAYAESHNALKEAVTQCQNRKKVISQTMERLRDQIRSDPNNSEAQRQFKEAQDNFEMLTKQEKELNGYIDSLSDAVSSKKRRSRW